MRSLLLALLLTTILGAGGCAAFKTAENAAATNTRYREHRKAIATRLTAGDIRQLVVLLPNERAIFLHRSSPDWAKVPTVIRQENPARILLFPTSMEICWQARINSTLVSELILRLDWKATAPEVTRRLKSQKLGQTSVHSFTTMREANPSIIFYEFAIR